MVNLKINCSSGIRQRINVDVFIWHGIIFGYGMVNFFNCLFLADFWLNYIFSNSYYRVT